MCLEQVDKFYSTDLPDPAPRAAGWPQQLLQQPGHAGGAVPGPGGARPVLLLPPLLPQPGVPPPLLAAARVPGLAHEEQQGGGGTAHTSLAQGQEV